MRATKPRKGPARRVDVLQDTFEQLVREVSDLKLPSLGPDFRTLRGSDLHDALVAHRLCKKFERPDGKVSSRRREASIQKFLDAELYKPTVTTLFDLPSSSRRHFLLAAEWLRGLKVKKSYRPVFPSGETYVSSGGRTDLFHKFSSEAQWTVSIDAVGYAATICYQTLYLRRLVKSRFKSEAGVLRSSLLTRWYCEAVEAGKHIGFYCFKRMFAYCCEIVGVDRITTVPKDNSSDRVISCVPFWTMVCQLSYAQDLRDALHAYTGIDLRFWQNVHRSLIRTGKATIDFSAASDSNLWGHVRLLFPKSIVSVLEKLRNGAFEVDDEIHPYKMFAPMGCGFTFEVLTMTLLSYGRVFDEGMTVFGDDVIIKTDVAEQFISFVESLGWKVNISKTFTEGNFRESCGAFCDLSRDQLLLSYDFTFPVTIRDCFINANKVARLVIALSDSPVRRILMRYYAILHRLIPRDAFVGWMHDEVLSEEVFLTPIDPRRDAPASAAVTLWEEMWQRRIQLCTVYIERPITSAVKRDSVSTLRAGCFLRRGAVYGPPTGKFKPIQRTIDVTSGVSLSGVTLVSVIT